MDERLNRSNRLPGSEKLTRPEEIGQLSKYLKSIKEVYEESTRLEDQLVGVSGRSTGKIPVIDSLEKKSVKTPDNQGEEVDLSQKILGVPGKKVKERLENKRLDLEKPKIPELDETIVRGPKNQGGNVDRLGDVIKKIQDVRNNELEDKRIKLLDERYVALEDTRLNLQAIINTSLENKRVDLKGVENVRLEDKKISLKDIRETELTDKRINLKDGRDVNLSDKILNLKKPEEVELGDKRLDIQDDRVESLEDKRVNLSAEENIELRDKRLDIKDENKTFLSDKILKLKDRREDELEDKRVDLKDEREYGLGNKRLNLEEPDELNLLPDKKIELWDKRKTKLEEKKVELKDEKVVALSDKKLELRDERKNILKNKRIDLKDNNEISLPNKTLKLKDKRENILSDKRINLEDEREYELGDKRLDLEDERNNSLSDKILSLLDERDSKLEDKRIDLKDERDNELEDKRVDLEDERENNLRDKKINIEDKRKTSLSDKKIGLEDERKIELEDKRVEIEDDNEPTLSDKILSLLDEREIGLGDKRIELEDERENQLNDKKVSILENENGEPTELYDAFLGLPENENGEPEELYSQFLGIAENQNTSPDNLSDKILDIAKNQNKDVPDLSSVDSIKEYTSKLSDAELYEFAMGLASEGEGASGEHDGWMEKVSGLMSAYLSSDILTPKRAIEFRDAINNTLEMSYFGNQVAFEFRQNDRKGNGSTDKINTSRAGEKSKPIPFPESQSETIKDGDVENLKPRFLRVPIDTSSGTIWAKAEDKVPEYITGTNRRDALDEMIVKMVDYKKISLPGGNIIDTVKDNFPKNASNVISGTISHNYPVNAPIGLNGLAIPGGPGDAVYQAANNRTRLDSLDHVGDVIGNTFYSRYWSSNSFKLTLEELCPTIGKAPIVSLVELKSLLKASPYITTPGKFMTDTKGSYNTFSLDTNMYWEVVLEPFCQENGTCSNGGFSYLPSIKEINFENEKIHKVTTNYGLWAPINGFELQKSKLQTKSLQLYEGEISYPTGMEFTNELRLTFVDDAWKSWKRYFEKCAQVAVFNSYPHKSTYYNSPISEREVTVIDKSNVCISPYKNITFNIRIYILNPQFNTLKKYSLLCVLKDFAEDYVGEIDSGGTDLNVSFSIVGENPEEDMTKKFDDVATEIIFKLAQQKALETQKRISGAINSSIGLL